MNIRGAAVNSGFFLTIILVSLSVTAMEDLVLSDFETQEDIEFWCGHTTTETLKEAALVSDPVAHGEKAMKVTFMPATYPGIAARHPEFGKRGLSDWSGREVFRMMVYTQEPATLAIRIDDAESTGYQSRYNGGVPLAKGVNYVQLPVSTIARAIDVSRVKTVILFLTNTKKEYTLVFDYIAVGDFDPEAEKKTMFSRLEILPTDPAYRMDVETGHVRWLKPYDKGPVKALFVPPISTGRDVIEVAQRLSCDFDVVAIDSAEGINKWGYGDHIKARADLAPIYWNILKKLEERPDTEVLILSRTHGWSNMPVPVQEAITDRVREGLGIVLLNPGMSHWRADRSNRRLEEFALLVGATRRSGGWEMGEVMDHPITRGIPFEAWPLERCELWNYKVRPGSEAELLVVSKDGRPVVAVGKYGKGRIVQAGFDADGFTPKVNHGHFIIDEVRPYRYWETMYAFMCRCITWAARKEPSSGITASASVREDGKTWLSIKAPAGEQALLAGITLKSEEGQVLDKASLPVPASDEPVEIEQMLSEPRPGRNFAIIRLTSGTRVVDSACLSFLRPRPATIESIEGIDEEKVYGAGENISFTVTFEGGADSLRAELVDGYERVASLVNVPAENNEVRVELPVTNHLSAVSRVRVRLLRNGVTCHRQAVNVYTGYVRDISSDYRIQVTGGVWKYPYHEKLPDIFRSFGVAVLNYGNEEAARGFAVIPHSRLEGIDPRYNDRRRGYDYEQWFSETLSSYQRTGDVQYLVKDPCLSDPEYIRRMQRDMEEFARRSIKVGGSAFALGDENSLTYYRRETDFCRSRHCMREFREWLKKQYEDISALNRTWQRDYQTWEEVQPITLAEAQKEDNLPPWADHRTFMEVVMQRTLRRAKDAVRKAVPEAKVSLSGTQVSTSFDGMDWYRCDQVLDEIMPYSGGSQDYLHLSFLDGPVTGYSGYGQKGKGVFHQIWGRLITGQTGGQSFFWRYELVNPDFTFSESGRDISSILREIHGRGIGKMLKEAQRVSGGIAIHYSMASMHAARAVNEEEEFRTNWSAWTHLLEDLGYQFRFVSRRQVEDAVLLKEGYKALVLPRSVALSPEEEKALLEFTAGGGVLLADIMPGTRDHHCALRPGSPLIHIFDGRKGILAGDIINYQKERLDPPKARLWRQKAEGWLRAAGVQPVLKVTVDGRPLSRAKMVRFDDGPCSYWGLLKDNVSGKSITMPDGTIEFVLTGEDPPPETIQVDFGRKGHVYEVRSGNYFGEKQIITDKLGSADMRLYALLPYSVQSVSARAPLSVSRGDELTVLFRISCSGNPAAHTLSVEVTGPDDRACHHYGGNINASGGIARHTFRTALNDPSGRWVIRATDVASGKRGRAVVMLR